MKALVPVIAALFITACTTLPGQKKSVEPVQRIAFISLKRVFNSSRHLRRDVRRVEKELAAVDAKIAKTKELIVKDANPIHRKDLQRLKEQRKRVVKETARLRKEMMAAIETAAKRVARKEKYDFVITRESGLIYGKYSYDITLQVIRELGRLAKRQSPVNR